MKKLTALGIASLPGGEYADPHCPGLIIRIGKNRRTWEYRYRQGGKRHRDRLGYYPAVGLAEARQAASDLAKRIDAGLPVAAAAAPHPRSPDALTLGGLIDRYEKLARREGRKIKTLDERMSNVRRNLAGYLSMPADQFSKADLRSARDKLAERAPIQANRMLTYLGAIMRWASQEDLISHNFTGDLRRSQEVIRKRVLKPSELAAIWHAAEKFKAMNEVERPSAAAFGRLTQFMILSGQRRSECASIRYGHILDGTWRQSQNKSDRDQNLKLPAMALAVIGTGMAQDFCFSGRTGRIQGFSKFKRELDVLSGTSAWRLHDIRRSMASSLQDLDVDFVTIEAVLNHQIKGVAAHYMHSQLKRQKERALQLWADEVAKIVGRRAAAL